MRGRQEWGGRRNHGSIRSRSSSATPGSRSAVLPVGVPLRVDHSAVTPPRYLRHRHRDLQPLLRPRRWKAANRSICSPVKVRLGIGHISRSSSRCISPPMRRLFQLPLLLLADAVLLAGAQICGAPDETQEPSCPLPGLASEPNEHLAGDRRPYRLREERIAPCSSKRRDSARDSGRRRGGRLAEGCPRSLCVSDSDPR